jgi:hypothetical protein
MMILFEIKHRTPARQYWPGPFGDDDLVGGGGNFVAADAHKRFDIGAGA